jgi:putative ABC transport system permease protein
MSKLWQDAEYALRTFAKSPGFAAVAILVLGVGIGANTAIFSIVNELLLRPLSGHAGDLVGLFSHDRTRPDSYRAFSYPNYSDIREQSDLFEGLMAHTFGMVGVPVGDDTRRTFASVVSSNYFDTLGVRLAAGRPFTAEEERPGAQIRVVIVPYARWQKEGLDPAFIGKTIRVNAGDFTVVGVTPEGFTGTMALVSAELYFPLGVFESVVNDRFKNTKAGLDDRANTALIVAGRLKPGLNEAFVASRLDTLSRQLEAAYPAENQNQLLTVSPLPRLATSTEPQSNAPVVALTALLMALSGVVLIIACLNIANMLLARGSGRRKELAVRLALGARRSRVVRQLLTESLLLATTGAALGLVLAFWSTRALGASLTAALPVSVTFSSTPDATVLLATVGFALLSTIAFGLGPSLRLSKRDLVADLKDRGSEGASTGRRFGARNLMVIGQVALSLAMLTAAGIFARTAITAAAGNPGHSYEGLYLASLDGGLAGFDDARGRAAYASVLARVRAAAGVDAATLASTIPFGDIQEGKSLERVGGAAGAEPVRARAYRIIGSDYFKTLGLRMVRGREFTRAEEESVSAPHVAIVDEAFARRMFPNEDPIGQMIRVARSPDEPQSTTSLEIVGVAPPIREELLDRVPPPHVYVPFGGNYQAGMFLFVRSAGQVSDVSAVDALRKEIRLADARLPMLSLSTMQAFHDKGLELWALKTGAQLFTILGLLALLLALVGVYAVKSYVVSQRTREIGIRMALGASGSDVLRLILRDGLFLTGAGVAIGLPLAIVVSIAFTKVFVEIGGFDPAVVSTATIVLALTATLAGAVPARRATKIQPLRALQGE